MQDPLGAEALRPALVAGDVVLVREEDRAHAAETLDAIDQRSGEARNVDHHVPTVALHEVGGRAEARFTVVPEMPDLLGDALGPEREQLLLGMMFARADGGRQATSASARTLPSRLRWLPEHARQLSCATSRRDPATHVAVDAARRRRNRRVAFRTRAVNARHRALLFTSARCCRCRS
jgi:hypothetical protein